MQKLAGNTIVKSVLGVNLKYIFKMFLESKILYYDSVVIMISYVK
ncbi:hypothetical protein VCRA2110O135_170023 [Vibrio crassostreae]|nr:hypothetical protein VCRA2110O135_170023 [Vibrio crassostreae]